MIFHHLLHHKHQKKWIIKLKYIKYHNINNNNNSKDIFAGSDEEDDMKTRAKALSRKFSTK